MKTIKEFLINNKEFISTALALFGILTLINFSESIVNLLIKIFIR